MKLNITLDGRRFYRSTTDHWLFGICGGLAQHFGWKPWIVRLATVVGTLILPGVSTALVIGLYIFLGLTIPADAQA